MHDLPILRELVIVLGTSLAVSYLLHRLHVPTMVGFLAAGVLIGPGGLGLVRDARAVVRPGDASDLAAKLTRVLTDDQLRSKLESDTATVRRAMSWETVVGRTFDIYCDVLDLRPAVSLPKAA